MAKKAMVERDRKRRKLIDPQRALPWDKVPSYGSLSGDRKSVV